MARENHLATRARGCVRPSANDSRSRDTSAEVWRISHLSLVLLATCERQRVDTRSKRRKWIVGELDAFSQVRRKEHQLLLGGVAVGNHGGNADSAELNCPPVVGPDQRGIV